MEFLNKKQKLIIGIIGAIMLFFIAYYIMNKVEDKSYIEVEELEEINNDNEDINLVEEEKIKVHITGEVENEGIIEIDKDSRIADVIEKAGGLTENADTSKINLAYQIKDGQKIYIPNIEKGLEEEYITEEAGDGVLPEEEKIGGKVNINTAKQTELETLTGIGPSTALKIINYRNQNGSFNSIEDIKSVPGIGESKFENIKNDICV